MFHIPAKDNGIADYYSRFPETDRCLAQTYPIGNPTFRQGLEGEIGIGKHKLYRIKQTEGYDHSDPWLIQISRNAEECEEFTELKQIIESKPMNEGKFVLRQDSPLKAFENLISELSLEKVQETNKDIILRDSSEVFIPTKYREQLLRELHSTHLSAASMKKLSRGKFFWPGMSRDIDNVYASCSACKSESISKMQKRTEVRPLFLDSLSPGQCVHLDFLEFKGKYYLILKDQYSGWCHYFACKDQTGLTVVEKVREYSNMFGLPSK